MRCVIAAWMLATGVLLGPAVGLSAQSSAAVSGRIVDQSGAPISGVQMVVVNQSSGIQRGALSQDDGRYVVAGVPAGGPYRVEAWMIGYGLQAAEGIELRAGETRGVDLVLAREAVALDALEVFASRAVERKSPV